MNLSKVESIITYELLSSKGALRFEFDFALVETNLYITHTAVVCRVVRMQSLAISARGLPRPDNYILKYASAK